MYYSIRSESFLKYCDFNQETYRTKKYSDEESQATGSL